MHKHKIIYNLQFATFVFSCLFLVVCFAHAQSVGDVPAPVQYTVSPQLPGPDQTVEIQAQGVGSFLGDANIIWSENGRVVQSGVGSHTFSFTTGGLGTQTKIHVEIDSSTEGTLTQDFTIIPSLVDLVWEADTTAPPLYAGKPLYSGGSTIKVVAFPTVIAGGAQVPSSDLSFQWSHDDVPVPDQSGAGDATFTFAGSQLQPSEDVSVDVYYGANEVGTADITIPATSPMLLLYDKDPLRGLLTDEALPSALSMNAPELTIQAVPYFFSNSSAQNGALTYAWTLNGSDTTGPDSAQGILTLWQTGSGEGAATLGVSLQNTDSDKLVQAATAAAQIVFGQSSGSSLFGL